MSWRLRSPEIGERYGNCGSVIRRPRRGWWTPCASLVRSSRWWSRRAHELIDGFKRVRALRQLGAERVTARVLEVHVHALKAAMLDLNRIRGAVCELEEGLVVHSLCREDGLSQVEVAALLGRHKSWVCRRLSLMERLCDEALEHIRLGLIGKGHRPGTVPGCHVATRKRPWTILKHRLSCRETARLVSLLLARPGGTGRSC